MWSFTVAGSGKCTTICPAGLPVSLGGRGECGALPSPGAGNAPQSARPTHVNRSPGKIGTLNVVHDADHEPTETSSPVQGSVAQLAITPLFAFAAVGAVVAAYVLQRWFIAAHQALGCRGMSRTDLIWVDGPDRMVVLEVNTIPGMTANSLLPKAARAAGIPFDVLLERLIGWALEDAHRRAH